MLSNALKIVARNLRNNMTEAEILLWSKIQKEILWVRVLRQKSIYVFTEYSWLDRYIIADFYIPKIKLVIEVDWNIHNKEEVYLLDREKEKILLRKWIQVLRIRNEDIFYNVNSVINEIKAYLI